MAALIPTVSWAQRKDKLYVTLDVQDVTNTKFSLANGRLQFSGEVKLKDGAVNKYHLDQELYQEIDDKESKVSVSPRNVFMVLIKKEQGHWPRLTKDSGKHLTHIKCDWNKWVDEDEEDETKEMDLSQYNFGGFDGADFSGMGGMGGEAEGEEEEDSDNEELPDLVK